MSIAKRLYRCDELTFTHSTAESAYWFGFILADGYIYERARHSPNLSVAIAEKDVLLLETFQRFLKSNHPIKYNAKAKAYRIDIKSAALCHSLMERGCTPAKSLTLEYPASGFFHRSHFIRGYFDGDGSIYVNEKVYSQATVSFVGTYNFLETLQEILVCEAGVSVNSIHNHAHSEAKYLSYTGRGNVKKLYDYLYAEDGLI